MKLNTAINTIKRTYGIELLLKVVYNYASEIVCKDLGIAVPEYGFYNNSNSKTAGFYNYKSKNIGLNIAAIKPMLDDVITISDANKFMNKVVDMIAHELRHAYQDSKGLIDPANYTSVYDNFEGYWNDDLEVDARRYAQQNTLGIVFEITKDVIGIAECM